MRLPFLAISYQLPSDGLPHYPHWLNTATDVYQAGYESKREPFEVRIKKRPDGSTSMLRVTVVKGVGRCSVIWFAILFTYFKLREVMTPEEMEDFRRWDCDYLGLEWFKIIWVGMVRRSSGLGWLGDHLGWDG